MILSFIGSGKQPDAYVMMSELLKCGTYQIQKDGASVDVFPDRRRALAAASHDLEMALAVIGESRRQSGQSDTSLAIIDARYHQVIGHVMERIGSSTNAIDVSVLVDKFVKLSQDSMQLSGVKVEGNKIIVNNNQTQINQQVVMPGSAYREFLGGPSAHSGSVDDLGAIKEEEVIDAEWKEK